MSLEQEHLYEVADRKLEKLYYAARAQDTEEYRKVDEELGEIYEVADFDWAELL